MKAIELLREDAKIERVYRSQSVYIDELTEAIGDYKHNYPEENWDQYCRVISDEKGKEDYEIAVKHMIRWGNGDASIMEKHWGISLPDWIHEFYAQIQHAVLTWRNMFFLMHPLEIIQVEDDHREWHENQHLPIRLIRFARVWTLGDYFAFRQSVRDNQWRIMYVSNEESTAYFQDASLDGAEDDEDINAWMERMIKTDGYPAFKDNEEFEKPFLERIG